GGGWEGEMGEGKRILMDPDGRSLYGRFGGQHDAVAAARRGEDVHVAIELGFADVVRGTTVELAVPRFSSCSVCDARGRTKDGVCDACGGRGARRQQERVHIAIP